MLFSAIIGSAVISTGEAVGETADVYKELKSNWLVG